MIPGLEGNVDTQRAAVGSLRVTFASFHSSGFVFGVKVLDALPFPARVWERREANLALTLEALSLALQSLVGINHADKGHDLLEISSSDFEGVVGEVVSPLGQALLDVVPICEVIREGRLLWCNLRNRNCFRPIGLRSRPAAPLGQNMYNLELIFHLAH